MVRTRARYSVVGVPTDTPFVTHTKTEIGDIAWHLLKDLPVTRDDDGPGGKGKPYWMVVRRRAL